MRHLFTSEIHSEGLNTKYATIASAHPLLYFQVFYYSSCYSLALHQQTKWRFWLSWMSRLKNSSYSMNCVAFRHLRCVLGKAGHRQLDRIVSIHPDSIIYYTNWSNYTKELDTSESFCVLSGIRRPRMRLSVV